mgnify:CR=1 FL=1
MYEVFRIAMEDDDDDSEAGFFYNCFVISVYKTDFSG